MRHGFLLAVLALVLVACGAEPSTGARCEIGRVQSCPCASGATGAQECSPAGVYGACVCSPVDAGLDVPAQVDAPPADVPDVAPLDVSLLDAPPDASADTSSADGQVNDAPDAVADAGVCPMGRDNCDGNPSNGCETNVQSDLGHCGICGHTCPSGPHSTASCTVGACGLICVVGFADCNGIAADGCETDLTSSIGACGACGTACLELSRALAMCTGGHCIVARCDLGFANCDGVASNGCETDLANTATNCGACGNACAPGVPCAAGACGCAIDRVACGGRCIDTMSDPANCGTCGHACTAPAGLTPACVVGACGIACLEGRANCDGMNANGCEVDDRVDPTNCGACGHACAPGRMCFRGNCL